MAPAPATTTTSMTIQVLRMIISSSRHSVIHVHGPPTHWLRHAHVPHPAHCAGRWAKPEIHLERERMVTMRRAEPIWNAIESGRSANAAFEPAPPEYVPHCADGERANCVGQRCRVVSRWDCTGDEKVCFDL